MWKRAVGWVTLCKWIIQQPHRFPLLLCRPVSGERAGGGQLEAGVALFYWLHHQGEQETERSKIVSGTCRRLHTWVILQPSVMFKCECNMIFSLWFCFFMQQSCTFSLYVWGCWQLLFPERSPWSEGHIPGRGLFAHCLFSSLSLLLLDTRSASFLVHWYIDWFLPMENQ